MIRMTILREQAKLTKAALARQAALDQALLSKIESGRTTPYEGQLLRLAAALKVPASRASSLLDKIPGEAQQ